MGALKRTGQRTRRTHIPHILVTLEVSHSEMSWLKLLAVKNLRSGMSLEVTRTDRRRSTDIPFIADTLDVSHAEMSPLNVVAS